MSDKLCNFVYILHKKYTYIFIELKYKCTYIENRNIANFF